MMAHDQIANQEPRLGASTHSLYSRAAQILGATIYRSAYIGLLVTLLRRAISQRDRRVLLKARPSPV